MPQHTRRRAALAAGILLGAAAVARLAAAYEVLDNGKLRFGNGAQASVNANGNLEQPRAG